MNKAKQQEFAPQIDKDGNALPFTQMEVAVDRRVSGKIPVL